MGAKIIAATKTPNHHFFGFHDIPAWNYRGDKMLSLEVPVINKPPKPGEEAGVGYVIDNEFINIGTTRAYNFPQGARMQWLHHADQFIVNNINQSFVCNSDLYDTTTNRKIDSFNFPCHHLHKDTRTVFYMNYARLHRLGAYGYTGCIDRTKNEALPNADGIFIGDINSNKSRLLISIFDIANYPDKQNKIPVGHHYVTHLLLNPSNSRLAFLHRYPLADGGEITRLMTVAIDGSDIRCIATGFLSHFDWKDDETILIYGRANSSIDSLRSNPILSNPIVLKSAQLAKKIIRNLVANRNSSLGTQFLLIKDSIHPEIQKVAQNIIVEDGHPMFCPTNRDWIINDTYPDENGFRELFLYSFSKNKKFELGKFKMLDDKPSLEEKQHYFAGVDDNVIKTIGEENLSFTRSGLHCDLHPRWDMQGKKIAFDSVHEGTRQIYVCDIENLNVLKTDK